MKMKYPLTCLGLLLCSCSFSEKKETDSATVHKLSKSEKEVICSVQNRSLPRIGEVESIEVSGVGSYKSRIDTGAKTVSIHAENIKTFIKEGEDFVSFSLVSDKGQKREFEKKIQKTSKIKSANSKQKRHFILLDLIVEGKSIEVLANLNDRSSMDYKLLIGRNLLRGNYVVDSGKSNYINRREMINFDQIDNVDCSKIRELTTIGTLEKVTIDNDYQLKARVDSGATRTSLHAVDIKVIKKGKKKFVKFKTFNHKNQLVSVEKPFKGIVPVRSALHEDPVKRYIVSYNFKLGSKTRDFKVSLADRSKLKYKLLIGRDFINNVYEVDTSKTYIFNK